MPRPLYIICSESGSEDKSTGLQSHFNVVEKLQITPIPQEQVRQGVIIATHPFRVVATWMRGDDDSPDQEYEEELLLIVPPKGREVKVGSIRFAFTKPLHRFVLNIAGPIPIEGPGVLRVESRIRRVGADDQWLTQDYPIQVELNLTAPEGQQYQQRES